VKTTKPSEDLNNPHGYSDMDWAAQLDPAYAAAKPVPNYASSTGGSHPPPARLPPHTTPAGHRRTAMKVPDIRRPETDHPAGHVSGGIRLPGTHGSCAPARFLAVCLSASCGHLCAVAQPSKVRRWWDAGAAVCTRAQEHHA
jgi:hypothetical protein